MADRLASHSLASSSESHVLGKAFCRASRPCRPSHSGLITIVCSSSHHHRRKVQVSATQAADTVKLSNFLLRTPTLLFTRDSNQLGVVDIEALERSLQATPSFSLPPKTHHQQAVEAPLASPKKRGRPGSVSTKAAQLFEAPTAGRLPTIKSSRAATATPEGTKRSRRSAKTAATATAVEAVTAPVGSKRVTRRRGRPARSADTVVATTVQIERPVEREGKKGKRGSKQSSGLTQTQQDVQVVRTLRQRLQQSRGSVQYGRQEAPAASSMAMFLRSIANTPVLGKREELALARLIQQGVRVAETRATLQEELGGPATDVQICERAGLACDTKLGHVEALAEAAEDLMVQYNLRLVVSVCKRYVGKGVDMTDLLSDGMQGLSRAVKRFNPSKGFKFSTYAHWWIRQAVVRAVNEYSRVVRLPVHVCDIVNKIRRVEAELNGQPNRMGPATTAEVGAVLGLPAAKVQQYMSAAKPTKSLEAPAFEAAGHKGDEHDMEFGETIAQPESHEDEELQRSVARLMQDDINALLSTLPPRERNVIRMRYGLHTKEGDSKTFKDIGNAYGLTQERIRQIEDKALNKLRRPWRQKLLRPHLYTLQGATL